MATAIIANANKKILDKNIYTYIHPGCDRRCNFAHKKSCRAAVKSNVNEYENSTDYDNFTVI